MILKMGANFAYHLYFVNKNNDSVYYIILIIRSIKKYRKNGAEFFCAAYKEHIKVFLCRNSYCGYVKS